MRRSLTFKSAGQGLFFLLAAGALLILPAPGVAQIYVTNANGGTIGEYDASTGMAVNTSLISGLNGPIGLAESGGNLFVANFSSNTIAQYAADGTPVNTSLVTGLNGPYGIAIVPEPSTRSMLALGLALLIMTLTLRRRRAWLAH